MPENLISQWAINKFNRQKIKEDIFAYLSALKDRGAIYDYSKIGDDLTYTFTPLHPIEEMIVLKGIVRGPSRASNS